MAIKRPCPPMNSIFSMLAKHEDHLNWVEDRLEDSYGIYTTGQLKKMRAMLKKLVDAKENLKKNEEKLSNYIDRIERKMVR